MLLKNLKAECLERVRLKLQLACAEAIASRIYDLCMSDNALFLGMEQMQQFPNLQQWLGLSVAGTVELGHIVESPVIRTATSIVPLGWSGVLEKEFWDRIQEFSGRDRAEEGQDAILIVERKGDVSSWIKLGPASLGPLIEGLVSCSKDMRTGYWEKRWQEKGRFFSLVRGENKGGCFLRLGVIDRAKKRFSIFIPKGRGAKGGWILLAEALREMESRPGGQAGQEDKGKLWIPMWGKSFAEVVKQKCSNGDEVVRVKVDSRAIRANLEKLNQCLVGSWNPRRGEGEDLRSWGTQMSKAWGLKGNLGLAKMNEGKVLLEFELVNEAEKALVDGEIEVEGLVMRLEKMEPKNGMFVGGREGRRGLDEKTERKEEIQWARIRVRINEGKIPKMVEVCVENLCYSLSLWWETRPTMRVTSTVEKGKSIGADEEDEGGGAEGEVEGEVQPREGKRVRKVGGGSRLEEQLQKVDGTRKATHGSGRSTECSRGLGALQLRPKGKGIMQSGPTEMGFVVEPSGSEGLSPSSSFVVSIGQKGKMDSRRIKAWKPTVDIGLVEDGQRSMREPNGHLVEAQSRGPSSGSPIHECSLFWEKDVLRRLREAEAFHKEQTKTDLALVEEAKRYVQPDCLSHEPPLSPSFLFGRIPVGEFCDLSGPGKKCDEDENPLQMIMGSESPLRKNGECWDLVEVSKSSTDDVGKDVSSDQIVPRVSKAGEEISWENSDLAKFSNFLGFSTEGLEKDIMEFLVKIRKRRERVHSKSILEKSKFERELKRLECSINYEGGKKQNVGGQETKIETLSEGVVRSLGSGRWSNWTALDAMGTAGGILVCWDKRSLEVMETEVGKFSVSYRDCLWEELGAIRGLWEEPWCIGGDFNVILSQRERSRQGRLSGAMRNFAQTVDDLELIDLPMQGGIATWSGGRNNQSWARLDRFLVTQQWLDMFSGVAQCRMHRPTSDHFPILLMGGGLRRGPTPFRFENMWLKMDDFKGLLRGWWQGIEARGRASFRLAYKMKVVKQNIKVWNREVFGRVEVNKNSALQQLEHWDGVESERRLSMAEAEQKKEAKDAFYKWVLMEEIQWRQKSRELWLKEGDRNTGYFHRMANAHRRNNSLDRITINGEMLTEDQEVREGIVNAFQNLLSEEPGWRADIEGLQLKQLNSREAENLEVPFSEEEIHFALMEMRGDKAPGPDGFTMAFWQDCWDVVKEEVMELFKEFFEYGSFAKSLNTTFLVLIPKKGGADDLGDFRPISLLGSLYKLLAKVLANRLKKVLDRVVSVDQNAFVRGRQILDASLVANEVLRKMGFGSRWEEWMRWCISTAKFSILINGVPAGFFSNSKGLRQGDPLSPYLFVLGMEVLSTMISRAGEGGFISGCRMRGRGGDELTVSHLLFADDTLIFCKARREQLTNLSWILAWFEAASGLRINLAKSVLIPVGEVDGMEELAAELGCKLGALPAVYLGLPLGANHKNASSWDGVEERMRRRLAQWKRQYISKGGRMTLIKSTLASIPIYLLSLIRIPKVVAKRIEKIQRDFLWGGGSLEGKGHLINWQVVCSPKEEGGLGIRKIDLLNKTLLGKWVWRYAYEKDNLWKKAIGVKYGQEGCGWRTKEVCGPYGVGLWKEIMKEAEWCWESMDLKVGKGNRVLFWMDKWCGNEALSQTFPQLFTLAGHKNAKVCEVWDSSLRQGGWNLSLARDLNDWEIDQIGEMLNLLKDFRISQEEDSVRWKREGNDVFGAKGAYRSLSGYSVGAFPNRRIWMDRVPTKVSFFAWEAAWGKILTLDKLQRRG
ncbi:Transposon TX1 uncharacterized 149 kDa protein [Vitis vinifera]|uniref:Transposon TX1 uncharacterized 149 kDa protein n=1 Tax=Vitis vinifera TaxID=29760 RepID=A0A438DFX7_VITVI|nr:Transposon TX1 uncharacterized 149 kDa protein [Vitis vinifera]